MSRPCLQRIALLAACVCLLLAPASASLAAPTLAYERDAALFLKQRHAREARLPGVFLSRKYAAMSDSAIGFFRGSAALFYRDVNESHGLRVAFNIPITGDLHLENMSAFRTASGAITFDVDDLDEAVTAPYTWELARTLVSLRQHAQEANFSSAAAERLVRRFLKVYVERLTALEKSPRLLQAPITASLIPGPAAEAMGRAARAKRKGWLERHVDGGRLRLGRKVIALDLATARGLSQALEAYAQRRKEGTAYFRIKDVARRMAGLASLSRQRYLALVEGATPSDSDDILLDLKAAGLPAAHPWVQGARGSQAERVRKAWSYFVPDGDPFLGVAPAGGGGLIVREMSPFHAEVALEALTTEARFAQYVDAAALVAARAHARSGRAGDILGDLQDVEDLARRLSPFSEAYARQVESDREIWKTYMDP